MNMVAPWTRFYSHSCCLCCHVHTGTILLSVWYLIINAVVLLILLSALADPNQYHFSGSELGGEFEFMDDASKYVHQITAGDILGFLRTRSLTVCLFC